MDLAHALFAKSMQAVLRDSHFRKWSRLSARHMDMLKLAVETTAMNGVYSRVFGYLSAAVAAEDADINKQARNLDGAAPEELGVARGLAAGIPAALALIDNLNAATTPLDKVTLLQRAVECVMVMDAGQHSRGHMPVKDRATAATRVAESAKASATEKVSANASAKVSASPISADELVPLLCLLVVRSENANWIANINYIRNVSGERRALRKCVWI